MQNIVIGGAWPYANGSLHIGHIAALLPGDVLARYHRATWDRVFDNSGSDCHGTPITMRARQEGKSPAEISEAYHREFCEVFDSLGFSYDLYTRTSHPCHKEFVTEFHRKLYQSGFVEERTVKQAVCPTCGKALTDRLVVGGCPRCGEETRGDQCDACGEVLDPERVANARCAECGTQVTFGETTQLFLLISHLREELTIYLAEHPYWRKNAIAFTRRYMDEGLRDRAITRDLDWGIDVPKEGYEDKKIYIWAENVLGYLSATKKLCEERGVDFRRVYGPGSRHYYVHGKDNIPFHTIILPALLLAHGAGYHLPDHIISSEYMTLEGQKISTSKNHAIWAKDLAAAYHPDAIRYFFLANGPEKRDADFSMGEFARLNNANLVGVWGNFVNRTLAFSVKYLNAEIPPVEIPKEMRERVQTTFDRVGESLERGSFRDALDDIFDLVRFGNVWYDARQPWKTRREDMEDCRQTIGTCTWLIGNLAVLLHPFLPFSSGQVMTWLGVSSDWFPQKVTETTLPGDISILFERIEEK